MFSGEVNAAFRGSDVPMEERLLARIEKSEGPSRVGIVVPHLGCSYFNTLADLGMDLGHVFDGLLQALMLGQ